MARLRSKSGSYDQGIIASSSAPSAAFVGQIWFNSATGVVYQWTTDGASNFWLDISSGGIGTSASRGVDFVGDTDPHKSTSTSGAGLAVGSVYYNREKNRHFICTNATTDGNLWSGRFDAGGGTVTDYESGGTKYRVHSFLTSGVFTVEEATTVDYLVIAGGGAGASDGATTGGGGGGAGGMLTSSGTSGGGASAGSALSMAAGTSYTITVGAGGIGSSSRSDDGSNGSNSSISGTGITDVVATGGGRASYSQGANAHNGGSGGGSQFNGEGGNAVSPTQGYDGWTLSGNQGSLSKHPGGGGGGAGGAGGAATGGTGGNGGLALANSLRTGSAVYYAGGGGGGTGASGATREGYGGGVASGNKGGGADGGEKNTTVGGDNAIANTGGGGGGSSLASNVRAPKGGNGGSGIVVIRYTLT